MPKTYNFELRLQTHRGGNYAASVGWSDETYRYHVWITDKGTILRDSNGRETVCVNSNEARSLQRRNTSYKDLRAASNAKLRQALYLYLGTPDNVVKTMDALAEEAKAVQAAKEAAAHHDYANRLRATIRAFEAIPKLIRDGLIVQTDDTLVAFSKAMDTA